MVVSPGRSGSAGSLIMFASEERPGNTAFEEGKAADIIERPEYSLNGDFKALGTIFCTKLNVLLIFVPFGLLSHQLGLNSACMFGFNFLAIVPLASIVGASTKAMATNAGPIIGGLLYATFGHAVEMIMCIQAIRLGLVRIVQGNLLGSILSNMLLILGMAMFCAGLRVRSQTFDTHAAAANMTCQVVASISVCLPTLYGAVKGIQQSEILLTSRLCSIFVAFVYFLFLNFQIRSRGSLFLAKGEKAPLPLSPISSMMLLVLSTSICAGCSEKLVESIDGVSKHYGLPKAFIGTCLLPIVGNAALHAVTVASAYKGDMDHALECAIGSSTQLALFVVPCSVLWGWVFNAPMTLQFRMFDTACQMVSVFLVSQVLGHGHTNWLHGAMLMTTYSLIAIMTCFIPETD